jgi:hypothetical protein
LAEYVGCFAVHKASVIFYTPHGMLRPARPTRHVGGLGGPGVGVAWGRGGEQPCGRGVMLEVAAGRALAYVAGHP